MHWYWGWSRTQVSASLFCLCLPHSVPLPSLPWSCLGPADYLLLQATAENLQEDQPLFLKCHSWKNWKVDKVTYYKNNVSLEYWYDNYNISMEKATFNDSGKYHCAGRVQMVKRTSEAVFIKVYKSE